MVLNVTGTVVNYGNVNCTSHSRVQYQVLGQVSSRSGGKAVGGGSSITHNTLALTSALASILIYCRVGRERGDSITQYTGSDLRLSQYTDILPGVGLEGVAVLHTIHYL